MATADDDSPAIPTGEGLPEELINEIRLRLPVKSLLRFKSVSKPWLSVISSPRFINSHLHHTATTSQTFIVKEEDGDDDYKISLLHLDSCETGADLEFPYSKGEIPFVPDLILVGSCNGIVCAAVSNCARLDKFQLNTSVYDNREVYLWNPATKYSKLIPPHNIRNGIMSVYYGFGFDPIGNDFKVVRVVSSLYYPFSAEVYSANRNAWRKVEPGPGDVPDDYMFDVCVKGFLCCAGLYGLMVFDLNNEVFRCGIEFPVKSSDCRVTEFNDSVAIFMYSVEEELSTKFSLWTLDDECLHGEIGESWTLMFTFDVALDVDMVHGHLNSGNILLNTEDYEWFLYNYKKRTTTVAPISVYRLEVFNYTESLVSIQGFKQVEWNADEADD